MQSVPTTPPILYIDLIETIISLLASESEEKPHTNDLSNCALVCRAWCNICRKISFANITTLDVIDSQNLHTLLSARSQGSLTPRNTIATHIRAATVHIELSEYGMYVGWHYAKELITLFGRSFSSNYRLRLVFNSDKIYHRHFLDILSTGAAQNLVYLALEQVTLSIDPEELSSLLCDESLPSLRGLVNQRTRTTWIPEPIKYQRDSEKAGTNSRQSQRTLDFLSFNSVYSHPHHE
ncbi:hypothetical protein BJ165DRAFT_849055 [Panaeolus papilionaceus]|nr:hypothetical protein BJ165DRAFT_849055 [Panaeolus papilionaceus]